jgi:parallel beta-helix repeat protein
VRAEPAVLTVPDDFSTIQEAINNAIDGDTIFVKTGTYYEHVIVNKSISLQGEDVRTTIIDGNLTGNVVYIVWNDVNITGFTIRNSGHASAWSAGIRLDSAPDSQIYSNNITGNNYGVLLHSSSPRVSILNNTIASNGFGIRVLNGGSGYLNVSNNVVMNNRGYGIKLTGNVTIGSHNETIANNLIMNNGDGIALDRYSNYNTISWNNIIMNDCGLYIEYSTKNMIHSNNFVDNIMPVNVHISYIQSPSGIHVVNPSANAWDNGYPSGGNYWSDYSGADAYKGFYQNETGSDGIGDTPVMLERTHKPALFPENNTDRYPLTAPWTEILGPVGDVNGDGKVDMKDIGYVARRVLCLPGEGLWDSGADLNGDGRINMTDIGIAVVARRARLRQDTSVNTLPSIAHVLS